LSFFNFKEPTYLGYLTLPRIVMGAFFLQVGIAKLSPKFLSGEQLATQLSRAASDPILWHRDFILQTVIPHAHAFAYLVCFGEIAIGVSFILGLLVRPSALFALLDNLNIYFAIAISNGGAQAGLNLIYMALEIVFLFASAGRALGIDALLKRRFPRSRLF
jgi:uncharacterized membrane protein YphA (DoxX/SURF4 family)